MKLRTLPAASLMSIYLVAPLLLSPALAAANALQNNSAPATKPVSYQFNFSAQGKPGYQSVPFDERTGAPLFSAANGAGFVKATAAFPAREVHVEQIRSDGKGFFISEPVLQGELKPESEHYNLYGMAFRMKVPPGAYDIHVKTTSDAADTIISVSGMQTSRLVEGGFWDAARLLPIKATVSAKGREWSYRFVNGREFIDIEVEPKSINTPVGIEEIVLTPIASQPRPANALPTIFTLGDSTVKSYTFDEAPMNGWGQVFDKLFDERLVNVINYSMGGRSFKNAYAEGRFNDLLLAGKAGDYVLIQFGHNDEREDEGRRFGRGATEAMYTAYINEIYLPAIRARGMIPVLITPMSRVNGEANADARYVNSFGKRRFPDLMKRSAAAAGVTLVDLNTRSLDYYNQSGVAAMTAIVMSIEAGETPGKSNDGSYANGHPSKKIDGTHFKEALAKQYARLIATEFAQLGRQGDLTATAITALLKQDVQAAINANDWSGIYPEVANDVLRGDDAHYRNQIEKMLQLGVMHKDAQGNFNPSRSMQTREFIDALGKLLRLPPSTWTHYGQGILTREMMGARTEVDRQPSQGGQGLVFHLGVVAAGQCRE